MENQNLATVAETLATTPFYGNTMGLKSNFMPIVRHFEPKPHRDFDGMWCAAFVYHCCAVAGYNLPVRHPEPVSSSFAAVQAWIEWAKLSVNRFYFSARHPSFAPKRGDLIIYDHVFVPAPHDHMGVVLAGDTSLFRVAEGNINNISAIVELERNHHIRGYIRIPAGYRYRPADS